MYQAAPRPATPPVDTVRVVLVLDVPAGSVELPTRTAQLADEFGRLIAHSITIRGRGYRFDPGPGVHYIAAGVGARPA